MIASDHMTNATSPSVRESADAKIATLSVPKSVDECDAFHESIRDNHKKATECIKKGVVNLEDKP